VHTSNLFRTRPGEALARALVERSFADRVFFCNSGGEANEAAIKFARRLGRETGGPAKHEIVALRGAFHGRLFGSLALTDRRKYQEPFEPLMPGAHFIDVADLEAARDVISRERTAAIFAEPVQGEGGVMPLAPEVLRSLRTLADEADALLVLDEVQCGMGRTGHLFAHERAGITPDILLLAKPLAGGLPMGAVLVTEKVAAPLHPGDHATTFGGGPLVASVALAVLERISEPSFLAHVRARGAQLESTVRDWIAAAPIRQLRGAGLMWGIELEDAAAPVIEHALGAGLLILSAGERVVRLLPPLTIAEDELDRGLSMLRDAIG
jgi:acetylornithine/succinyldiaminopimelate/putrescine aminotransferase